MDIWNSAIFLEAPNFTNRAIVFASGVWVVLNIGRYGISQAEIYQKQLFFLTRFYVISKENIRTLLLFIIIRCVFKC